MYYPHLSADDDLADAFDLRGFLADCQAERAADAEADEAAIAQALRFACLTPDAGSVEAPPHAWQPRAARENVLPLLSADEFDAEAPAPR